MSTKKILNYSPNFDSIKRKSSQIKFLIFHYTGMKKESDAIKRLTNIQSEVSSHYLIKKNGDIVVMVPDLYVAWHAGKSSWKSFKSLNKNSIGIEISNPGHEYNYINFSKKQILSVLYLSKSLIKKYKIQSSKVLGHSDVAPFRKKDPGEKFPWKTLSKKNLGVFYKNKNLKTVKVDIKKFRSLFFKNIHSVGYRYFSKNKSSKSDKKIIKAFQRRFLPSKVSGKIDQKTLDISHFLAKKFKN